MSSSVSCFLPAGDASMKPDDYHSAAQCGAHSSKVIIKRLRRLLLLLAVLLGLLQRPSKAAGRILNQCSLTRELLQLGVPREELPIWTCIARFESKYNTSAIGRLNGNWSNDFGIFQLSDRYWCVSRPTRASTNLCNVDCGRLLSDDLRESLRCAQLARKLQGWHAWAVYRGLCERRHSKYGQQQQQQQAAKVEKCA